MSRKMKSWLCAHTRSFLLASSMLVLEFFSKVGWKLKRLRPFLVSFNICVKWKKKIDHHIIITKIKSIARIIILIRLNHYNLSNRVQFKLIIENRTEIDIIGPKPKLNTSKWVQYHLKPRKSFYKYKLCLSICFSFWVDEW